MAGRRRLRASWLLTVLLTSVSLGVCTPLLGDDAPCCPDPADAASFSVCCHDGDEPSSKVPPGVQGLVPPAVAPAHVPTHLATYRQSLPASPDTPHRSADFQALLSIFLI